MSGKYTVPEWHNPLQVHPELLDHGIGQIHIHDVGNSLDIRLFFETEEYHNNHLHKHVICPDQDQWNNLADDQKEAIQSAVNKAFSLPTFVSSEDEFRDLFDRDPAWIEYK